MLISSNQQLLSICNFFISNMTILLLEIFSYNFFQFVISSSSNLLINYIHLTSLNSFILLVQ